MTIQLKPGGTGGGIALTRGGEANAAIGPISIYRTNQANRRPSSVFGYAKDLAGANIRLPAKPRADELWSLWIPVYNGENYLQYGVTRFAPLWDLPATRNGATITESPAPNYFVVPSSGNGWTVLGRTSTNLLLIGYNGSPMRDDGVSDDSRIFFLKVA